MRWKTIGLGSGLLAVLGLLGCAKPEPPKAGETVTPKFSQALDWKAGQPGLIAVRLTAASGDAVRQLDFDGIPASVNPIATVTFYEGDQEMSPVEVALSKRC